jgi:hypothetical protein
VNNALTDIPPQVRRGIYAAYGLLALAVGALAAFYLATPDTALPDWLDGAQRVIAYLAIPVAAIAVPNVFVPSPAPPTAPPPAPPSASSPPPVPPTV